MSIIYIKEFDDILDELHQQGAINVWSVKPEQANATMLAAYKRSKEVGTSRLNFHDWINDTDVKPIADTCRRLGIKEFTITVMQGLLVREILPAFQKLGIRCYGTTKVEMPLYSEAGGRTIDGLLMKVVPEKLTREEFGQLVHEYQAIQRDVNILKMELRGAISRLDETLRDEDNEDDAERREWCREILGGLESIRY